MLLRQPTRNRPQQARRRFPPGRERRCPPGLKEDEDDGRADGHENFDSLRQLSFAHYGCDRNLEMIFAFDDGDNGSGARRGRCWNSVSYG